MKKTMAFLTFCSLCSLGSFGVLLLEDQKLGVPLPYSLPLAYAVMAVLAPVAFLFANRARLKRPIVVSVGSARSARSAARTAAAPAMAPRQPSAEGVVLLDFSRASRRTDRAA